MACASNVTIEIDSSRVPLINGALELVAAGMLTGADKTNREYVGEDVSFADGLDPNLVKLFYDPQTAGGLLLAISEDKAEDLLTELRRNYPRARSSRQGEPEKAGPDRDFSQVSEMDFEILGQDRPKSRKSLSDPAFGTLPNCEKSMGEAVGENLKASQRIRLARWTHSACRIALVRSSRNWHVKT